MCLLGADTAASLSVVSTLWSQSTSHPQTLSGWLHVSINSFSTLSALNLQICWSQKYNICLQSVEVPQHCA